MNEIRLYKSFRQGVKLIGLNSIFVVPSVYFIVTGADNQPLWWMSVSFFGLGYVVGAYLIFDRRPQIILNEIGIFDRNLGNNFINWEIIRQAYLSEINKQLFICLEVDEEFEPSRKKGGIYRSMAKLNKELGFQELNIAVSNVNVNAQLMVTFINLMTRAEKPKRHKLIEVGLGGKLPDY